MLKKELILNFETIKEMASQNKTIKELNELIKQYKKDGDPKKDR